MHVCTDWLSMATQGLHGSAISTVPYSTPDPTAIVMEDVEITDNYAHRSREEETLGGYGGGARFTIANVQLSGVLFRNNTAEVVGGGMSVSSETQLNMTSCAFINNRAQSKGGGLSTEGQDVEIQITSTPFQKNIALQDEGGCLFLSGKSSASLTDVELKGCIAGTHGGGASLRGESELMMKTGVAIRFCEAIKGMGGGVLAAGQTVMISSDLMSPAIVEKNRARSCCVRVSVCVRVRMCARACVCTYACRC